MREGKKFYLFIEFYQGRREDVRDLVRVKYRKYHRPIRKKESRGQQKPRSLSSSVVRLHQERPYLGPVLLGALCKIPVTYKKNHLCLCLMMVNQLSTLLSLVNVIFFKVRFSCWRTSCFALHLAQPSHLTAQQWQSAKCQLVYRSHLVILL